MSEESLVAHKALSFVNVLYVVFLIWWNHSLQTMYHFWIFVYSFLRFLLIRCQQQSCTNATSYLQLKHCTNNVAFVGCCLLFLHIIRFWCTLLYVFRINTLMHVYLSFWIFSFTWTHFNRIFVAWCLYGNFGARVTCAHILKNHVQKNVAFRLLYLSNRAVDCFSWYICDCVAFLV